MAAKATTRAAPAQATAKSMRQLNKENEDLQAQVDQLTSSLQSVHAGKQAVKLSYEVCVQAKLGVAHGRAPRRPAPPPQSARTRIQQPQSLTSIIVCVCVCVCVCSCPCRKRRRRRRR